jgi:hypothetical protein
MSLTRWRGLFGRNELCLNPGEGWSITESHPFLVRRCKRDLAPFEGGHLSILRSEDDHLLVNRRAVTLLVRWKVSVSPTQCETLSSSSQQVLTPFKASRLILQRYAVVDRDMSDLGGGRRVRSKDGNHAQEGERRPPRTCLGALGGAGCTRSSTSALLLTGGRSPLTL